MVWTTPRTWVSGEIVTAAHLNTHLRDNLDFLFGPGTVQAFTPVLVSLTGTQPVLGTGGVANAVWASSKGIVHVAGQIRYGSSGVTVGSGSMGVKFGDGLTDGPPDANISLGTGVTGLPVGLGRLTDNNTGNIYFLDVDLFSTNRVAFWNRASPATATTHIAPVTLAVSDYFGFQFSYPIA